MSLFKADARLRRLFINLSMPAGIRQKPQPQHTYEQKPSQALDTRMAHIATLIPSNFQIHTRASPPPGNHATG